MKQLLTILIATVSIFMTPSCKEVAENDGKTLIIQDSLNSVLPTWQALKIKVEDNRTRMTIVVGDATFYKASNEVKSKKAEDLGKMILRIYGKDNYLEKGNLIVTKDIHNTSETPEDGINTPIDFTELKKVVYPAK
ncbi:MAG: hypothetical protein ACHQD8_04150 [Chitinophagales bacterium]